MGHGFSERVAPGRAVTEPSVPKLLLVAGSLFAGSAWADQCRVNDPDIAASYAGECVNGLAQGTGTARGRDTYTGTFVAGDPHGQGIYVWGGNNHWTGQRYEGEFVGGEWKGFGALSVPNDPKTTDLEFWRKAGTLENDRYVVRGLWDGRDLLTKCDSPEGCLAVLVSSKPVEREATDRTGHLNCSLIQDASKRLECFDSNAKQTANGNQISPDELSARKAVLERLTDPESVRWGEFTLVSPIEACLTFNAKNQFGGYSGNREAGLIKQFGIWVYVRIVEPDAALRDLFPRSGKEYCREMMTGIVEKSRNFR